MSIVLHLVQTFFRDAAPLKRDMWECTLHSFKGHGVSSKGILHICRDIVPAKTHCIAPEKQYN